jgi:hypothetical protein
MAVSGKTAAPHEIPYFLGTDKPPDMAAVTKAIADRVHARLNETVISGIVTGAGAVGAGSGFTAKKTATGTYEITLTNELVTSGVLVASPTGLPLLVTVTAGKKVLTVTLRTSGGELLDSAFHFMVKAS